MSAFSSGEVPTLVLMHAFPLNSSMWQSATETVRAEGFRVLAPDFPGFGSTRGRITSLEDTADQILAILESEDISEAGFCGMSMGGYVLFEILRKKPELVSFCIFCDTTPVEDSDEKKKQRFTDAERIRAGDEASFLDQMVDSLVSSSAQAETVAGIREMMSLANPASMEAAMCAMANRTDSTELLGSVQNSFYSIFGEDDPLIAAAELFGRYGARKGFVIKNAGHFPVLENPAGFNDCLKTILKDACND